MKRHWEDQELSGYWSLSHDEFELVRHRTDRTRLGFAALLKFFQVEGCILDVAPHIHSHVNPYGSFELDMEKRLSLD